MGLFNKLKGKKDNIDWSDAYIATPSFYEKSDGCPFGAFPLTEGVKTVLPLNPQLRYKIDEKTVQDWRLVLVSTTKNMIIADVDYFVALNKLNKYSLDNDNDTILLKGLSLEELETFSE